MAVVTVLAAPAITRELPALLRRRNVIAETALLVVVEVIEVVLGHLHECKAKTDKSDHRFENRDHSLSDLYPERRCVCD